MGEMRSAYRILVVKLEGRRRLGRPRHRQEYNIKIDLWEMGLKGCELDSSGSG
jgi:hypothetical protein